MALADGPETVADISFHVQRIDQAHKRLDNHDQRLTSVETLTAVMAERNQNVRDDLNDIKASLTWLTRLVIGGIIGGAMAYLISGGFHVG